MGYCHYGFKPTRLSIYLYTGYARLQTKNEYIHKNKNLALILSTLYSGCKLSLLKISPIYTKQRVYHRGLNTIYG